MAKERLSIPILVDNESLHGRVFREPGAVSSGAFDFKRETYEKQRMQIESQACDLKTGRINLMSPRSSIEMPNMHSETAFIRTLSPDSHNTEQNRQTESKAQAQPMLLINYKTENNFHKLPNSTSKSGVSLQYFNRGRNTAVHTQQSTMKLAKTYGPSIQEDIQEMNRQMTNSIQVIKDNLMPYQTERSKRHVKQYKDTVKSHYMRIFAVESAERTEETENTQVEKEKPQSVENPLSNLHLQGIRSSATAIKMQDMMQNLDEMEPKKSEQLYDFEKTKTYLSTTSPVKQPKCQVMTLNENGSQASMTSLVAANLLPTSLKTR